MIVSCERYTWPLSPLLYRRTVSLSCTCCTQFIADHDGHLGSKFIVEIEKINHDHHGEVNNRKIFSKYGLTIELHGDYLCNL